MAIIISKILIFLLIINLFFLKIFSNIASKSKLSASKNDNKSSIDTKKSSFFSRIRAFLYYYYQLNLLYVGCIPSFRLRALFYKYIFNMQIGSGTKIRMNVEILFPWNIKIGDNCFIGKHCILDGRYGLTIENNVNISDEAAIWTMQHDINDSKFGCNGKCGCVTIKSRVWLCFRSVVLPKVTIGEGVVLATNAIATKDCEDFGIYTGIPAKKNNIRNDNIDYELDISRMHFT